MIESDRATTHDTPDELLVLQPSQAALDLPFGQFHHRLTVRFLVARRNQGIERERVVLGRRELLFHQRPEDPDLD